jgi:hypothetical protein
MAGLVRIDGAEPRLEKPLVDRAGKLRQRVAHVDDLVEARPGRSARSPDTPSAASNRLLAHDNGEGITAQRAAQFAR